ncbi:ABC transporter ATP-binding protein [Paenibacillus xylanilyticus]|uniref:ABC transporter ATP-binding protein n=1 Tax=Paenibacillus xylanilyticus TaxID=248903 RepID=UPI0039A143E2
MNSEGLVIKSISKSFGSYTALDHVNVNIPKGKFTCLLGPSGCGKTTLLRILAGLEQADQGSVIHNGREITGLSPAKRNFGIVFQSYALFPNLTVKENIAYGLKGKMPKRQITERVSEMLKLVDLEGKSERYPSQISGGQQQRVAIARAIALSPDVLLLDEPLSALDAKVRDKLRSQLRDLQQKLGITMVMVTHDQEEALTMADQIVVMDHGRVMQCGTPQEVYDHPSTPFVADFIGMINFIPTEVINPTKEGKRLAIRPEHISLVTANEAPEEEMINGYVKHVEFRGSSYRINLQVADTKGSPTDYCIFIDIASETAREHYWAPSSLMKFRLISEHILEFEEVGAS